MNEFFFMAEKQDSHNHYFTFIELSKFFTVYVHHLHTPLRQAAGICVPTSNAKS
jgi:hypothetical protein